MLASRRRLALSLPRSAAGRRLPGCGSSPTSLVRTSNALSSQAASSRAFGSAPRRPSPPSSSSSSNTTTLTTDRHVIAANTVILGAAAAAAAAPCSVRHLSLWGYGWSSSSSPAPPKPDAAAATTPPAATTPATSSTPANAPTSQPTTPSNAAAAATSPPSPSPSTVAEPPLEPAVSASELDLSSVVDTPITAQDVLGMSEGLGYLHAIGLDYGWGPTSMMQWTVEHIHVWTGLGWAASIILTAASLRLVTFYPQVRAMRFNAKMTRLKRDPRSAESMRLMQLGVRENNPEAVQRGKLMQTMLRKEHDIQPLNLLWSFAQIPLSFGLFRIVTGMANVPVPALETAGFLWFPNLSIADPYYVLPFVSTGFMVAAFWLNSRQMSPEQSKMVKPIAIVFGVVGIAFASFFSAAVNLMGASLAASTLLSSIVLANSTVRRVCRLPPLEELRSPGTPATVAAAAASAAANNAAAIPTTSTSTTSTAATSSASTSASTLAAAASSANVQATWQPPRSPASFRDRISSQLNDAKKGLSEQLSSYTGGAYGGSAEDKAEQRRREIARSLEERRRARQREDFARKYRQ